jgi:hypothetical protein
MLEYELTVTLILFHYEVASRITKVGVGILGPPSQYGRTTPRCHFLMHLLKEEIIVKISSIWTTNKVFLKSMRTAPLTLFHLSKTGCLERRKHDWVKVWSFYRAWITWTRWLQIEFPLARILHKEKFRR